MGEYLEIFWLALEPETSFDLSVWEQKSRLITMAYSCCLKTDATFASGIVDISITASPIGSVGFSRFIAGGLAGSVVPPTPGTIYGVYNGLNLNAAFSNPNKLDLMQVVNEGNQVVWNLTSSGITNVNPTSPTSNALVCQFEGSSFATAFPNPNRLDLMQIQSPGGGTPFHVDYQGNANYL